MAITFVGEKSFDSSIPRPKDHTSSDSPKPDGSPLKRGFVSLNPHHSSSSCQSSTARGEKSSHESTLGFRTSMFTPRLHGPFHLTLWWGTRSPRPAASGITSLPTGSPTGIRQPIRSRAWYLVIRPHRPGADAGWMLFTEVMTPEQPER